MKLFRDNLPELTQEFRKEAGFTHRLSETPENWPQEMGSQLYKQLPFLSDYEVNVDLEKTDAGRGFAFGYADVSSKTERPELEHGDAGIPHVRIPLIAEERQVRPFSVYLDGERVLPMNEDRFRESLFNPATFDLSNSVPRDPSLVEPLMPPQRSGIGLGGEYKMAASPENELYAMLEKKADSPQGLMASEAKSPDSPELPWPLRKYKNTPFLKKAIALERRRMALDNVSPKPPISETPEQKARQKARDQIHKEERALELDMAEWYADKMNKVASAEKTAFAHISKDQWNAIYKSGPVQSLVLKHGKYDHPEITNTVYEMATKHYGFHPKLYPMTEQEKMRAIQMNSAKMQQGHLKHQNQMNKNTQQLQKLQQKGSQSMGMGKTASLLEAIAPTIRETDKQAFVEKVASDPTIRAGFKRSGIASLLVGVMDKGASADERLQNLSERISPSVVTFQKLPGGDFFVKSASVTAFANTEQTQGQVVPFEEVAEAIGEENAQALQPGQVVTTVSDPVNSTNGEVVAPAGVSEFGEYKVQDADGKSHKGWVFPQVLSWDAEFQPQPVSLFTDGGAYALQESVLGEKLESKSVPKADIPKGDGVFWGKGTGGTAATAPITIESGITGSDGISRYSGTDVFGNAIEVAVVPNLKSPQFIADNKYAVPKSWNFMRLNNKVSLANSEEKFGTTKKHEVEKTSAVLFFNGAFNFKGGCGLDKVASEFKQDLDPIGAEFLLGLLGVDGVTAKQKVAEARKKGSVKLAGLKTITLLSERYSDAVKTASAFLEKLPDLRKDLIKEAAAIEDQGTVDKVLALNFINPENLSTFVEYLPELEQTSEQMAEMVLAGYLGMKEIPVQAVERSMHNMEEVIRGLKAIEHAESM